MGSGLEWGGVQIIRVMARGGGGGGGNQDGLLATGMRSSVVTGNLATTGCPFRRAGNGIAARTCRVIPQLGYFIMHRYIQQSAGGKLDKVSRTAVLRKGGPHINAVACALLVSGALCIGNIAAAGDAAV